MKIQNSRFLTSFVDLYSWAPFIYSNATHLLFWALQIQWWDPKKASHHVNIPGQSVSLWHLPVGYLAMREVPIRPTIHSTSVSIIFARSINDQRFTMYAWPKSAYDTDSYNLGQGDFIKKSTFKTSPNVMLQEIQHFRLSPTGPKIMYHCEFLPWLDTTLWYLWYPNGDVSWPWSGM